MHEYIAGCIHAFSYFIEKRGKMKQRNRNADLIRCVAVYSVLSVHFLLNSGFYSVEVQGTDMLLMCMVRSLFMVCVPLFMILSGYLMWHKKLSRNYYKGLGKTIEIYVLASIACLLYKKLVQGEAVTLKTAILGILDFDAANYAWYIEMYICLFLMIPFFNLIWNGLQTKKEKQILILTMAAVTFLPKMLNNFNLTTEGWFFSPSVSTAYDPVVPSFFTSMYPITYYFIGAYLSEYDWKIPKRWNLLLLLLAVGIFGCYNYYRSDGGTFVWAANSTWGGENMITALLLFTLLLHINLDRMPDRLYAVLRYISQISLGIYLISWIFDKIVYNAYLKPGVPVVNERWKYYGIVVPSVFLLSIAGATVLYAIRKGILVICQQLTHKRQP